MSRPTRAKQPGEARTLGFDFTEKLPDGDTLTGSPTITVTPTGELTASTGVISGAKVNSRMSGGVDGKTYIVQCSVNTTSGDILLLDVVIEIREDEN